MKQTTKNKDGAATSLKKLEYLSLVSKVRTELESHLGFTDKVLAEFITDLGRKCLTVDEFDKKLKKKGADLPDYFVRTLLNVIHGKDLLPLKKRGEDGDGGRVNVGSGVDNKSRIGLSGIRLTDDDVGVTSRRPLKKMSSPERWEVNQLIALGVLSVKDYPMYDEETNDGMVYQEEGGDEELEVELNEDEPAFLKVHSHYSMDMSPVKIFKNPEGSLSRAAALQSALIKERREVRD